MAQWIAVGSIVAPFIFYGLMQALEIYRDLRPNIMKAIFIDDSRTMSTVRVTLDKDGDAFSIGDLKYDVIEKVIVRTGKFRVPTSYYVKGVAAPIDLFNGGKREEDRSAEDFHLATEAHVAQDILKAFEEPFLSAQTQLMIIVGVVVVGIGALYYQMNEKFGVIIDGLGLAVSSGG